MFFNMGKLLKQKYKVFLKVAICILLYRVSLDYIYLKVISPIWDYQHFYTDINNTFWVLSYVWVLLIILFDYQLFIDRRPSSVFLLLLDQLFFLPMTSVIPLAGMTSEFFIYCFLYWVLIVLLQKRILLKPYDQSGIIDLQKKKNTIYFLVAAFIIGLNFIITVHYFGFHIKIDLKDVYDIRFAVRALNLPTSVKYLKPIAAKLTLVTILILLIKKKYIWLIPLVLVQLENFAFGALKSDFFALLLVFIVGVFYKTKHLQYVFFALIGANLLVIIEYLLYDVSFISIVIHRRILYMPSIISYDYYSFFSENEFVYFRDSFMRHFGFKSPYDLEVPRLIGREMTGNEEVNCNTGIIGDDYAQLGWLGLLVFPYLRYLLLRLYDKVMLPCSEKLIVYVSFIYVLVFVSGTLFSSLITGGFLIICFMIYLLTKEK